MGLLTGLGRTRGGWMRKSDIWAVTDWFSAWRIQGHVVPDPLHRSGHALPPITEAREKPAIGNSVQSQRHKGDTPAPGVDRTIMDKLSYHACI